jgi:hypothetical protein
MRSTKVFYLSGLIFSLIGFVGPLIAYFGGVFRGNGQIDYTTYTAINLLWPTRILVVYDYSVATVVIINVAFFIVVGLVAATAFWYLHRIVAYVIISALAIYVWLFFCGFDPVSGLKTPLLLSLFLHIGGCGLVDRFSSGKKTQTSESKESKTV